MLPGAAEGRKPSAICFFAPVQGDEIAPHRRKRLCSGVAEPPQTLAA
jgi:hypothetical protein